MSGKNPFKIIEEENIRKFNKNGPSVPIFLNQSGKLKPSSIYPSSTSHDSPTFPSF